MKLKILNEVAGTFSKIKLTWLDNSREKLFRCAIIDTAVVVLVGSTALLTILNKPIYAVIPLELIVGVISITKHAHIDHDDDMFLDEITRKEKELLRQIKEIENDEQ